MHFTVCLISFRSLRHLRAPVWMARDSLTHNGAKSCQDLLCPNWLALCSTGSWRCDVSAVMWDMMAPSARLNCCAVIGAVMSTFATIGVKTLCMQHYAASAASS